MCTMLTCFKREKKHKSLYKVWLLKVGGDLSQREVKGDEVTHHLLISYDHSRWDGEQNNRHKLGFCVKNVVVWRELMKRTAVTQAERSSHCALRVWSRIFSDLYHTGCLFEEQNMPSSCCHVWPDSIVISTRLSAFGLSVSDAIREDLTPWHKSLVRIKF